MGFVFCIIKQGLSFSSFRLQTALSCGICRRVVWWKCAGVSRDRTASIIIIIIITIIIIIVVFFSPILMMEAVV
jgi:hypothetical protein